MERQVSGCEVIWRLDEASMAICGVEEEREFLHELVQNIEFE